MQSTITIAKTYKDLVHAFETELHRPTAELVDPLFQRQAPWSEIQCAIGEVGGT